MVSPALRSSQFHLLVLHSLIRCPLPPAPDRCRSSRRFRPAAFLRWPLTTTSLTPRTTAPPPSLNPASRPSRTPCRAPRPNLRRPPSACGKINQKTIVILTHYPGYTNAIKNAVFCCQNVNFRPVNHTADYRGKIMEFRDFISSLSPGL